VNLSVIVFVAESFTVAELVAELNAIEEVVIAACELGTERNPRPKLATTTNAARLKNVFVDIYFLSKVVWKTFSHTAGKEKLFAS